MGSWLSNMANFIPGVSAVRGLINGQNPMQAMGSMFTGPMQAMGNMFGGGQGGQGGGYPFGMFGGQGQGQGQEGGQGGQGGMFGNMFSNMGGLGRMLGSFAPIAGSLIGARFGGPTGAAAGNQIGSMFSNLFSGANGQQSQGENPGIYGGMQQMGGGVGNFAQQGMNSALNYLPANIRGGIENTPMGEMGSPLLGAAAGHGANYLANRFLPSSMQGLSGPISQMAAHFGNMAGGRAQNFANQYMPSNFQSATPSNMGGAVGNSVANAGFNMLPQQEQNTAMMQEMPFANEGEIPSYASGGYAMGNDNMQNMGGSNMGMPGFSYPPASNPYGTARQAPQMPNYQNSMVGSSYNGANGQY